MSERGYRPLGGYSPSLQPVGPSDITENEQLNLDGYARASDDSRPNTPPPVHADNLTYNDQSYDSRYGEPSDDVEAQGLIKEETQQQQQPVYRLYKRRWIGLVILTLHHFIIAWVGSVPNAVPNTAREWYGISLEKLDTLSIASNIAFIIPAPFCIWSLNRLGPKWSINISIFFGTIAVWIIFASAETRNFNLKIAGTVIHSFFATFSLSAPTRYSRMWFGDKGRTFATGLPPIASLFGAGIGAVTGPYMVKPLGPFQYNTMILIVAVVTTAVAIPAPFMPNKPRTQPSLVASQQAQLGVKQCLKTILRNKGFYLQLIMFAIFAGTIETSTAVLYQSIAPYGFTQKESANALAILIFLGIVAALIVSPILDKWKKHALVLKIFLPILAVCYTILPWLPETHSVAALYALFAVIGACSISLEPALLEYQASWVHPVSPEFAAVPTVCAAKGLQALLVFLVGQYLPTKTPEEGQPAHSLFNGLLLLAGLLWVAAACALLNGVWIFKRTEASRVKGNS